MTIYRLHRAKRRAADYTGAMMAGDGGIRSGSQCLYAAQHRSFACLDELVHVDKGQLPRDYVWSQAELVRTPQVLTSRIPASVTTCQTVGGDWINGATQLAIRVPSVVIPKSSNILRNPNHATYAAVPWSDPRPFYFDVRLFIAEPNVL